MEGAGGIVVLVGSSSNSLSSSDNENPIIFHLEEDVQVGLNGVETTARHFNYHPAELLELSEGKPGQSIALRNAPVVQKMGNDFDIRVAVELSDRERRRLDQQSVEVVEELDKIF